MFRRSCPDGTGSPFPRPLPPPHLRRSIFPLDFPEKSSVAVARHFLTSLRRFRDIFRGGRRLFLLFPLPGLIYGANYGGIANFKRRNFPQLILFLSIIFRNELFRRPNSDRLTVNAGNRICPGFICLGDPCLRRRLADRFSRPGTVLSLRLP